MVQAVNLLLTGCLLQGVLCREFKVFMPETIKVLNGSCVTIPCSFDIAEKHDKDLDKTCRAIWKKNYEIIFDSSNPQQRTIKGNLTGNLQMKNCSTTLNNMSPDYSNDYTFRLECDNPLKYNYQEKLKIHITADPPTPSLTPSILKEKEGTSVSLVCSAPAPCLSHPPALTWTPSLGRSKETLKENQDKTKDMTSVLTFNASHLHHGKNISCTAAYNKQDGSTGSSVSRSVTADISFVPKILPSSDCAKPTDQINCSCESMGNPSPMLHWYLDGLPVNNSEFNISINLVNGTALVRSVIIVNKPQDGLFNLVCHSTNSLGSASQKFCVQTSAKSEGSGPLKMTFFITTVVALLILVCALLFVIRAQRTRHNLPNCQCKGDTSTVVMSQLLTNEEGNELPNTAEEEDIYVNNSELVQSDVTISETNSSNLPCSEPKNAEGDIKSSVEKEKEEGNDVIYSSVTWKSKKKKEKDSGDTNQPGSSYLEEERHMMGDSSRNVVSNAVEMGNIYGEVGPKIVKKEVESEYAQVKFKDKNAMQK